MVANTGCIVTLEKFTTPENCIEGLAEIQEEVRVVWYTGG